MGHKVQPTGFRLGITEERFAHVKAELLRLNPRPGKVVVAPEHWSACSVSGVRLMSLP